ncbi:MAG TPA: dihydrofolate reductase family protein [Candidatus Dormibacteraeota bacterium]|nr:dihydrofolate reductase family protein [Candidatus Dormibacteraeota bacterium]
MRKVVASIFVTVDGVVEDPGGAEGFELGGWSFKYGSRSDDDLQHAVDLLRASDALLLGRKTYEGFAQAWPSMTGGGWYADRMNSLPKYVVSSTLDKAEWNNSTIIKGDVAKEVAKLKQQPGQDILIFGSSELANGLLQHELIDELRLLVHPVVLGRGKRLFAEGSPVGLTAAEAKVFGSGIVLVVYHPAAKG